MDGISYVQIYTKIYSRIRVDTMNDEKRKRDGLDKHLTTPNGRKYINPEWKDHDINHYLLSKWNWLLTKSDEYDDEKDEKKRKKDKHPYVKGISSS